MTETGTTDDDAAVRLTRLGPGHMHIVIEGVLAATGAAALQSAMLEALIARPSRIHLDLTGLTECSPVGIAALATCLNLARQLDDGVGVSVAGPAARRALLRSLTTTC